MSIFTSLFFRMRLVHWIGITLLILNAIFLDLNILLILKETAPDFMHCTPIIARNRLTLENIDALIYVGMMYFKSSPFLSKKGVDSFCRYDYIAIGSMSLCFL